ncbi:PREDICTED: bcl-2-like protein 12 isoform X2 [Gavialis gangeticus]|uniref:bcl-2-like protein 12 isoform X2 n=1 Tax=Gavialis gangeticus TaxID=94835 RepID=UPI00092EFF38|nr:PREDICTED: bcl-2-like protein 12 isoform X2 [Gavialis gangeticus]XP_019357573.1 PREDICTED: bcl-2-like protein 12 isoform X2 [Gavialis gangeticus]
MSWPTAPCSNQLCLPGQLLRDPALYARAAQKLDKLLKQQQQLNSPGSTNGAPSPRLGARTPDVQLGIRHSAPPDPSSETANEQHREQVIQRLISLLEEQAKDINREMEADPLLRSTLSRMSFRSFSQLAEAFTARAPPSSPSPQLARLALTMELTRRVAGISNHAVQTLMGYSLQYMELFVPWLQQQGGWESIVGQDELFDLQLD